MQKAGLFLRYVARATGFMVEYNYKINLYNDLGFTSGTAIILRVTYDRCHGRNSVVAIIMDHFGHIRPLSTGLSSCITSPLKARWKLAQLTLHLTRRTLLVCYLYSASSASMLVQLMPCHTSIAARYSRRNYVHGAWYFSISRTFLSTVVFLAVGPRRSPIALGYNVVFACL
ncbi:hypothetical protein BD769DRAFT_1478386 [Suillus cothurnatus]|nr:hypothetical protein BD769DRAFT_1478386 [Suillus cothurnatus]